MGKFQIDTETTEGLAVRLTVLRERLSEVHEMPENNSVSGETAQEAAFLCQAVKNSKEMLKNLIDRTIEFLNETDTAFRTSEKLHAEAAKGKN